MRQRKVVKMLCSIPPDVRPWIEAKAAHELVSMNSVLVAAAREKMADEQRQRRTTPEAVH
jgi:hypothetical protein